MILVAFVSVLAVSWVVGAVSEFPLQRCKAGDTSCLATTMTAFLHGYSGGHPELGLASIDPLYFGNLTVTQGGNGPVTAKLSLYEASIEGWRKAKVTKVVGFGKDPRKSKFELLVKVPFDTISGYYSMNGRILLIPIFGTGKGNVSFNDLEMNVRMKTAVETRDGEDYLKINKVHMDITCRNMISQFDNLFNDPVLSKNINKVMNDNSMILFNEVRALFGLERGKIVKNWMAPLFAKYPYRMLFAAEDERIDRE